MASPQAPAVTMRRPFLPDRARSNRARWTALGLLLALLAASPVQAQVPRLISYQGSLVEGDFPVSGSRPVAFALYPSAEGGNALWSETDTVEVIEGRFSTLLGNQEPFGNLFAQESELYLEVAVGGQVLDRLRLTSTAFALRAGVAAGVTANAIDNDALADGAVNTPQLANGSVTTAKLQNDAVTRTKIQNGSVTRGKLADGAAVERLSNLSGNINIVEGDGIQIETNSDANTITISADGGLFDADQPSSRRWKTDIRPIDDALKLVQALHGVRYEWKESGREDIGLIAEEVSKTIPEVVTYKEGQAQAVNYGHLVAVLIEALKQQQRQLDARQADVEALSERVARLERLMKAEHLAASQE